MTHQGDNTEYSHSDCVTRPTFVDVTAGSEKQPGIVKLYWSGQICYNAQVNTLSALRALLHKWDLVPNAHSVSCARHLGELNPDLVHGLPFLARGTEAQHTLSDLQLDIIYRELDVAHRYPGQIIAKPITLDNGVKSHRLTAERIVRPGEPFVECADHTEMSQRFYDKVNLRFALNMGERKDEPTTETTKQVWIHGATMLAGMNAAITKVTFV